MINNAVRELFEKYMNLHKIAGGNVIIRRQGTVVCKESYGYADMKKAIPVDDNSIFRMASMTKPVIAAAIMQLEEKGFLSLDDPLCKFLPSFQNMKAADRLVGFADNYEADPDNPAKPKGIEAELSEISLVDLKRDILIRDLLCHCSGMGQGLFSMRLYKELMKENSSLKERVDMIAKLPLDFQPGEHTGYSAAVAYEVLGRLIEVISGKDLNTYIKKNISEPLNCELAFELSEEQKSRVVRLYEAEPDGMRDVTETEPFWNQVSPLKNGYYSGSAGILGTVEGYDRFVKMLASEGKVDGWQFLQPETVKKMYTEASAAHLEMNPGATWGIGMMISEDPLKTGRMVGKGTYGWSGAYGTHFYIDRENDLTVVLGVNCANIGGADSQLSRDLEKVVFEEFCR